MKKSILLITIAYFSFLFAGGDSEKVDGDYIMHHIQDDRVFELFNPFDYNDANKDHYYFTKKIKLDYSWNQLNNIPCHQNFEKTHGWIR